MAKNISGEPYLNFDGASYFDLGIIPTGDFAMEIDARALVISKKTIIVGTQNSWSSWQNRLNISYGTGDVYWFANQSTYNNRVRLIDYVGVRHRYYVSKSEYGIDGTLQALGTLSEGTYNQNMLLGTLQEYLPTNDYSMMDFFSLKCWRNGSLIAQFVPVGDNTIKDIIGGTIISNLGIGNATIHYE